MKGNKEYFTSLLFACLSIITLLLFLITISFEIDSSRYVDSSLAIKQIFKIEEAKLITNKENIWDWLLTITSKIGGKTSNQINTLCKYDIPNQQIIKIDNNEYIIDNPITPTYPCQYNITIIEHQERMISLSGNNQLLAFVLYFSNSDVFINGPEHGQTDSLTLERIFERPNAYHNPYYIQVLQTSWGWCVLTDGKYQSLGSTLQWKSKKINKILAFEYMSYSYLNDTIIYPCYSYSYNNITNEYSLLSGIPNYQLEDIIESENNPINKKKVIWIVSVLDYYIRCKNVLSSAQPIMAYLTKYYNLNSYYDLEYLSLCNNIINKSLDSLVNHFIYDNKYHQSKLNKYQYGSFLTCSNELNWVKSSHEILTREMLMDSLNEYTRSLDIYSLSRNLGSEDYFYTLAKISFNLDDNGRVHIRTELSYSPIVQFTYGLSNYSANFKYTRTYILEIISAIIFTLYSIHLVYCIFLKIRTVYLTRRNITPINDQQTLEIKHKQLVNQQQDKNLENLEMNKQTILVHEMNSNFKKDNHNEDINNGKSSELRIVAKCNHEEIDEYKIVNISDDDNDNNSYDNNDNNNNPSIVNSIPPSPHISPKNKKNKTTSTTIKNIDSITSDHFDIEANNNNNNNNNNKINNKLIRKKSRHFKDSLIYQFFLSYNLFIILDVMTVILVLFCLYYRLLYVGKARNFHNLMIKLDIEEGDFDSSLENIVDLLIHLGEVETIYVNVIALTIGILLLQFLRYISFDKRFVIISFTIYQSASLLLPVLLVFVIVWSSYAVIGQAMYGKILGEFSTIFESLNSLFFFVLGETSIYNSMISISPNGTPIYFWTYIVVVYFILFNMVLAIIMFVYEENARELQNQSQHFKLKKSH